MQAAQAHPHAGAVPAHQLGARTAAVGEHIEKKMRSIDWKFKDS